MSIFDKYLNHKFMEENDGNGNDAGGAPESKEAPADPPASNEPPATDNEKATLLKDVMAKKEQIRKLNAQAKELQAKLALFDGIDPEAVKAMIAKQKAEDDAALERKGEYERLKTQMIEAHDKEKAELTEKLKAEANTVSAMMNQIAELTVGNAFANSSFVQNDTILTPAKARKFYGDYFGYVDGQVVGYDKPVGKAERTVLVDAVGEPLAFDEALKKVMDMDGDKEIFLRSKVKPGAGSRTQSKTPSPGNTPTYASRTDKIAAGIRAMKSGKTN